MKNIRDKIANTWLGFIIMRIIIFLEFNIFKLYHEKRQVLLMKQIINEDRPFLLKPSELYNLYSLAGYLNQLEGDYAEVGVYKGATAKAICEAKGDKRLFLFDTFEGLPETSRLDSMFKPGMFKSDFDKVKEKLAKYKNVHIYKGLFPETGKDVSDNKFALVHLDVDIYKSTIDCLNFFYSRMTKGGVIISHDYHNNGVKTAYNEFFKDKPEKILELPMSQCLIMKA